MKKFLVISLLSFVFYGLNAQTSNLIFFTEEGEDFTLFVNGAKVNDMPQSRVEAYGVEGDMAMIKAIIETAGTPVIKSSMMIDQGNSMTSMIKMNKKGKYVFRPVSSSPKTETEQTVTTPTETEKTHTVVKQEISTPSITGPITAKVEGKKIILQDGRVINWKYITLNGTTRVSIEMKEPVGADVTLSYDGDIVKIFEVPFNYREMDYRKNNAYIKLEVLEKNKSWSVKLKNMNGYRILIDGISGVGTSQTTTKTVISTSSAMDEMTKADFERVIKSMEAKSFADEKMMIAKQVLKNHYLSVQQVIKIMAQFTMEQDKLDFAKSAYSKTSDKQNYYQINDALTFSDFIEELNEFLKKQN